MKRINEKVKDLVEVRNFRSLQDFFKDPAETVHSYQFTDTTSDMMSKWLDRVSDVQHDSGRALALAGYRGVGKSHFLATLGSMLAQPELRSRIAEQHVALSTQRLKRRRYPVAFVRRGTQPTLLDEIRIAVAESLTVGVSTIPEDLTAILTLASEKAGDLPFVMIIDTAFERMSRVARNDGELLGRIAAEAAKLNLFVGVALDDDIAGADGSNLAISRAYAIDYLDQEHLYRIVDTHVFPKARQTQPLIHEIYNHFREILPHFRWSEQRFSALYPLHPIILEVAPYVRFYDPDFALLGFASEAGNRVLGRPANSLIALDEVFDCAEQDLRRVEELREAFASYDKLNSEVVGQIPVMQRLQAKLILKGLLLLSLDGNGTTAGEISAAMLIFDESNPQGGLRAVEDLLESFVARLPDQIQRKAEEGREVRYSLKVSVTDDLNNALRDAIKGVPMSVVPSVLRKVARERFSDWTFGDESGAATDWSDSHIVWRGGVRRGRICWNVEQQTHDLAKVPAAADSVDWAVFINPDSTPIPSVPAEEEVPRVYWQHAELRRDEVETILRYYALLHNKDLHRDFAEQIRTVGHSHTLAVEKIWKRIFLEDARLVIEGLDYNFTETARNAGSLAEIFTEMLEPLFEMHFPDHPRFGHTLGMADVSALVQDLFSGARPNLAEVQRLAEIYAFPLGLVVERGGMFVPESEENLLALPVVGDILALVRRAGEDTVSLRSVYRGLRRPPVGLVREAQQLVLAALVANRKIEFVTSKGDRINRRSLDLKIIWDDIEGIARPADVHYSGEKLSAWARLVTGIEQLGSVDEPESREAVLEGLRNWLSGWRSSRLLERFNELPDEILNNQIWRLSVNAERTFGSVATTVGAVADRSITLEDGLARIADAFSDSPEEFEARTRDLVTLEDFISGSNRRQEIWSYLAVCEPTDDGKIEFFREKLLSVIRDSVANPSQLTNREMENFWQSFHHRYSEHFAIKHDMVMKSHHLQEQFDEIIRSDEWWEFENLSRLPVFPQHFRREAQMLCGQFRELDCRFSVRDMLRTHPFCACSFNLARIREWERLPQRLRETIANGRESYRKILLSLRESVVQLVSQFAKRDIDEEYAAAAGNLTAIFAGGREIPQLSNAEVILLQKVFERVPTTLLYKTSFPVTGDYVSRSELQKIASDWMNEIPDLPALVRI